MILTGDVFDVLPTLDAESVHCVVTSPPYWGLRDYSACNCVAEGRLEVFEDGRGDRHTAGGAVAFHRQGKPDPDCPLCGGTGKDQRVAGHQLGLEPTPEAYIERMVAVFREVRRVLRSDGTVWLNIGDTYNSRLNGSHGGWNGSSPTPQRTANPGAAVTPVADVKPKDLVMIPARLAHALQADGWWLRSDIIWSKPNPMPESVTDRPTSAHEHVFLLTKASRYYFDADAVREPQSQPWRSNGAPESRGFDYQPHGDDLLRGRAGITRNAYAENREYNPAGRNLRNVWTIPTEPFPEAHFATYPKRLVEPCIKAGTSERGCCGECGAPWEREVSVSGGETYVSPGKNAGLVAAGLRNDGLGGYARGAAPRIVQTTGWRPTCTHDTEPVPCTVLDPFAGSGTTGVVAARLGREFTGIELSPEYAAMAERRISNWRREYAENPAPKVLAGQEGLW